LLPQDRGYSTTGQHPIFDALMAKDVKEWSNLWVAFEISKARNDWGELVVATGPLQGQSVLHLVAGQKPGKGFVPHWYEEWCDFVCREVCVEYGYLWVGRGGGRGKNRRGRGVWRRS
jgi:hypothetical protein